MATRGEKGTVWLRRDGMKARLIQEGSKIRYERLVGDPLAYDGAPEALTPEEWLTVTNETDYPDAPVQLMQIFRSPRAGDVILSARPGHDLRERHEVPEHKGTHGSLHRDHMLVPLISSVSLRGPVRSVDIFPTICQQLGIPIHHKIDGISRT